MQHTALLLVVASLFAGIQAITSEPPESSTGNYSLVHDVLRVLPMDKIREIQEAHVKSDDGFKAAVLYLQGQEWRRLVNKVVKSPEYKKFAEMTQKLHLNISQAINCTKTYIDSLKVVPTRVTSKPNLESFITDIQKALPIGDLVKALSGTDNSVAERIREEMGTKENQKIADDLHNLPEMVKMRKILKEMNFDVEPYIGLLYAFLGWVH